VDVVQDAVAVFDFHRRIGGHEQDVRPIDASLLVEHGCRFFERFAFGDVGDGDDGVLDASVAAHHERLVRDLFLAADLLVLCDFQRFRLRRLALELDDAGDFAAVADSATFVGRGRRGA
jgi:hypothetical protein